MHQHAVFFSQKYALGMPPPSFDDYAAIGTLFDGIRNKQRMVFIHSSTISIAETFVREILEAVQKERYVVQALLSILLYRCNSSRVASSKKISQLPLQSTDIYRQ